MMGMKGIGKEIKKVTGDLERLMGRLVELQEQQVEILAKVNSNITELKWEITKTPFKQLENSRELEAQGHENGEKDTKI